MNRRSFLRWLGIGVPAAAVAAVLVPKLGTSVPESECSPDIRHVLDEFEKEDWRNMVENLKSEDTLFEKFVSRQMISMNMGVKRNFFVYNEKS